MPKIANEIEWLIDIVGQEKSTVLGEEVEKIKLSQMVSKLGFFYEKIRNAVDYKEEHLIRRNSIERFLKRQIFFLQEKRPEKISRALIYEFIRARYLPNDALPESFIADLARPIAKYLAIQNCVEKSQSPQKDKINQWLIGLASCEINEWLSPIDKELALANIAYSHLVDNLKFTRIKIDDKEKNLQIYLAVLRTLLKADQPALRYYLLKLYVPNWANLDQEGIRQFCDNLALIRNKIEKNLAHPLGFQLARTVRPQAVFFSILGEMMKRNKENLRPIFEDENLLEDKIEEIAISNYQKIQSKLIGTIIRVIIYILLTKTVLAFIFELPYDYFVLQAINWPALIINVVFHPILMFLVAVSIRVPGAKNTQIIVTEIKKIVYGEERKLTFKAKNLMKLGSASFWIFNAIYLVMFMISFGIILSVLRIIHFNAVSGLLFLFFLTLVSFLGFRLRNLAKELSVMPRKENFAGFLLDFLSLPIIRVGRFFSTNFSKINIFLYILDFMIETPFKMLVEFFERTVSFINDKKEEIEE